MTIKDFTDSLDEISDASMHDNDGKFISWDLMKINKLKKESEILTTIISNSAFLKQFLFTWSEGGSNSFRLNGNKLVICNNGESFNEEGYAVSVSNFLFEGERIWFATDEFVTKEQPQFNIGGIYI